MNIVHKLVPEWYWAWDRTWREKAINQIWASLDGCVMAGQFKGMRYGRQAAGSVLVPKLLGIYEKELHQHLEHICAPPPQTIIDIGAAEGYYAIGLLLKYSSTNCIAFESSDSARLILKQNAELNGVQDRLFIRAECDVDLLKTSIDGLTDHTLIIADIEGAEKRILDPKLIPSLRKCRLLVECHDFMVPGCRQTLVDRFRNTHQITTIGSQSRSIRDLPEAARELSIPTWKWLRLIKERPVKMTWLVMTPIH